MERSEVVYVNDFEDLTAHVYTIGYPVEGEAILFVLCNKGNPIFTSLTDCYVSDGYNHVEKVISSLGNHGIDAFFWTHPDSDHSIGIRDVLDKFDEGKMAHIFLPASFDSKDAYDVSDDAKKSLVYLYENYNSGRRYRMHHACVTEGECRSLFYFDIMELKSRGVIRCDFKCMAPVDAIVARRKYSGAKDKTNDLSIVYTIEINGCKFLFTGDMTNQTVQFIDGGYLRNVNMIKIPHHASDEPKNFIRLLSGNNIREIVSVTTRKSPNLPVQSVVNAYKGLEHEVYYTGSGTDKYGCVEYCMNIKSMLHEVACTGNAMQL